MAVVDSEELARKLDKHGVPGASVAVLRDGEVTTAAAGVLHLGTGVEATTDSLFQIGSITKVWTATIVLQLVEENAIDLDDPVRRFLPEFSVADAEVSERVTVRHLLTHSSGIDGDHFADKGRGDDVLARYVESCASLQQVHPLGATMSYCNTGYSILGRIVEVVTGDVWDAALRTRIVEPLGLTHVATLPEDVLRFRAAMGHIALPGSDLAPAPVWGLPRSAGPAGLICATASDLLSFARMHMEDSAPLLAMRAAEVEVPSGGDGVFPQQWGLGWGLYTWGERTVLGHDGSTIGQSAFLRVVPDAGVAVALLTNGGNAISLFADMGAELLGGAGVTVPAPMQPLASPTPFDAAAFVGTYAREGTRLEVVDRDGALVGIQSMTGPAAAMSPDPVELPLVAVAPEEGRFLTRHPAAGDAWLGARFLTLSDGSECVHMAGRATPKVA